MTDFWVPQPQHWRVNEDAAVERLCLRYGFGAVMDSAARQWLARDPVGAITLGPCAGSRSLDEAHRKASEAKATEPNSPPQAGDPPHGKLTAEQLQRHGDISSVIGARLAALPGPLIDCPVCGSIDKARAEMDTAPHAGGAQPHLVICNARHIDPIGEGICICKVVNRNAPQAGGDELREALVAVRQQEKRCRDAMQFGRADEWAKHVRALEAATEEPADLSGMRARVADLYAEAERLEAVADRAALTKPDASNGGA